MRRCRKGRLEPNHTGLVTFLKALWFLFFFMLLFVLFLLSFIVFIYEWL